MLNLSHKNLALYKISLLLVKEVYSLTKKFPKEEQYGLVSQLRRAAVSVCSNLAEGSARISAKEKKRFYEIARASLVEIDTQVEISILLEYLSPENIIEFAKYEESVFKILSKFISNLGFSTH
ncbi:MAG: four helix bundle protein [Rhizobacter sp.]|nr:four helix bundle protein [Ferruginibacter sp.]